MRDEYDRRVHATLEDGRELVRYDRAGKWYIEPKDYPASPRRPVSLAEAVAVAAESHVHRGQIHFGLPGAGLFDKRAHARVDELHRAAAERGAAS